MAFGKHTDQSSYSSSFDDSYKAVDGNSNTSSLAGLCSLTNLELNPWWRVDLARMEPVSEVYVVNSGDCCTNRLNPFEIRVGWSISIIIFISDSVIKNGKDITDVSEPHRLVLGSACPSLYKARNPDPAFLFILQTSVVTDLNWRERRITYRIILRKDLLFILIGANSSHVGTANPKCGDSTYSVPTGQGVSFYCRPSLYGRYVTIRLTKSSPERLTLCEVEVYSARRGTTNHRASRYFVNFKLVMVVTTKTRLKALF